MKYLVASFLASTMACVALAPARAADLALRPSVEPVEPIAPQETPFFVHLGPAGVLLDEGATIKAGGVRVPGATVKIAPQVTAAAEAGYFVTPAIAIALTVGVPPEPAIEGAGTVAGFGKLGSILYGPTALTAQYHLLGLGRFQPYVGAGPMYMIVFSDKDGALTNLHVDPAWGFVGQVGADVMVTDRWGVFVDLKKAYLRTEARGSLGPIPIKAEVRLDPLVLSGGVTYRF